MAMSWSTCRWPLVSLLLGALTPVAAAAQNVPPRTPEPTLGARSVRIIEHYGLRFKDLNRSGSLDRYEDWRLSPDERARDLAGRMTLEEKAGAMMHGTARSGGPAGGGGAGTQYDLAATGALIRDA